MFFNFLIESLKKGCVNHAVTIGIFLKETILVVCHTAVHQTCCKIVVRQSEPCFVTSACLSNSMCCLLYRECSVLVAVSDAKQVVYVQNISPIIHTLSRDPKSMILINESRRRRSVLKLLQN